MSQVMKPHIWQRFENDGQDEWILFMDHLKCQKSLRLARAIYQLGGCAAFGPRNMTETWQPIDAGHLGAAFKEACKSQWEAFMEASTLVEGLQNWRAIELNHFTARQKRIAISHIVGETWQRFTAPQGPYTNMRMRSFIVTGCAITVTGKNDNMIEVLGWTGDLNLLPPGTNFDDEDYIRDVWTAHPHFFGEEGPSIEDAGSASSSSSDESSTSEHSPSDILGEDP